MPLNELLANAAMKGAAMKTLNDPAIKMCHDCAFKKGTDANNDDQAVQDAADCIACFGTFNCHNESGDAGKPCAGFLFAKEYMKTIE